jgi:hypothetical protein
VLANNARGLIMGSVEHVTALDLETLICIPIITSELLGSIKIKADTSGLIV